MVNNAEGDCARQRNPLLHAQESWPIYGVFLTNLPLQWICTRLQQKSRRPFVHFMATLPSQQYWSTPLRRILPQLRTPDLPEH